MTVHVNDSWPDAPCVVQRQLQKLPGGNQIAVRRQHEIDGVANRVYGPIQIHSIACNPQVGFIDSPGPVRRPTFSPDSLIENWRIPLNPAPHGRMINREATLCHEFVQIPVA
jgi:hypothetical protein